MPNPLDDALFAPHRSNPRPLIIDTGGSGELGYDAFLELAGRMAAALFQAGLAPGDRIAVQTRKSPQALALFAACVSGGIVFIPLNTAYTGAEIAYFLADSQAALIVCDPEQEATLGPIAARNGARLETLDATGGGSLMALVALQPAPAPPVDRSPGDLAAILYTSGTTGRPKGAMLTQENLLSNAAILTECWHFDQEDVLLHALPIFHTHGLFVACNVVFLSGSAMIFQSGFSTDAVIAALPHATVMMGVPTFYTRLLDDPRLTRDLVAHMRLFTSGSAPLLPETHIGFETRTGHRLLERYGMTETGMNASNPYHGERRPGTVGFPLPGVEIRITDPATGRSVARDNVGVLEVRGANVFKGYWNMPEKTAEEFRPDGFFITGDLATRDEDGYLRIVGRQKDLIISGGYNIYPREVELVVDALPGVRESAVIGIPHRDFGEAVVAIVVPEPGAAFDPEEASEALGQSLARFKLPKRYVTVEQLPRNAMGKVQKAALRATYRDLLQQPTQAR